MRKSWPIQLIVRDNKVVQQRQEEPTCSKLRQHLRRAARPGARGRRKLLALEEVLQQLEHRLPRAGQVVEFRYVAGLTEAQTATALGISVATVKRDWDFAKL